MLLKINARTIRDLSKIEVEGIYEISPEEGTAILLHCYNKEGKYQESIEIRNTNFDNLRMEIRDE